MNGVRWMVLVDFNGLAVGSIMGSLNRGEGLSENLVKHIIINNLCYEWDCSLF